VSKMWTDKDDAQAREWMRNEAVAREAERLRVLDQLGKLDRHQQIARGRYEFPPPRIVRGAREVGEWAKAAGILAFIMALLQCGGEG